MWRNYVQTYGKCILTCNKVELSFNGKPAADDVDQVCVTRPYKAQTVKQLTVA